MTGKRTAVRVLPDGRIENTAEGNGRLLGTEVTFVGTTLVTPRPDGTATGEGQQIVTTKDGEAILAKNSGLGVPKGLGGAVSIRGTFYWQTQSEKFARLNRTVGIFEAEQDAQGNLVGKIWEWK